MICERPHCYSDAVDVIPLPQGLKRTGIYVCAFHSMQARIACYFVHPINAPDTTGEAEFHERCWAKHRRLRGSNKLKYRSRQRNMWGKLL